MKVANNLFFGQVEQMLDEGQEVQLRIKGHSMRPLLRSERDVVVLTPYRTQTLCIGDVVLFRYRGSHVLHRIVDINNNCLTLEGDGNYRLQEHCLMDDVLAIVRQVIRPNGTEIACHSRRWRGMSRAWRMVPPFLRRCILGLLFRLGWR